MLSTPAYHSNDIAMLTNLQQLRREQDAQRPDFTGCWASDVMQLDDNVWTPCSPPMHEKRIYTETVGGPRARIRVHTVVLTVAQKYNPKYECNHGYVVEQGMCVSGQDM